MLNYLSTTVLKVGGQKFIGVGGTGSYFIL